MFVRDTVIVFDDAASTPGAVSRYLAQHHPAFEVRINDCWRLNDTELSARRDRESAQEQAAAQGAAYSDMTRVRPLDLTVLF